MFILLDTKTISNGLPRRTDPKFRPRHTRQSLPLLTACQKCGCGTYGMPNLEGYSNAHLDSLTSGKEKCDCGGTFRRVGF